MSASKDELPKPSSAKRAKRGPKYLADHDTGHLLMELHNRKEDKQILMSFPNHVLLAELEKRNALYRCLTFKDLLKELKKRLDTQEKVNEVEAILKDPFDN